MSREEREHRSRKRKRKRKRKASIRLKVFKKYNYQCFFCGSTENLTLHHIIPKSIGGRYTEDNLIPLCKDCHKKLHLLLDPVIKYLGKKNG